MNPLRSLTPSVRRFKAITMQRLSCAAAVSLALAMAPLAKAVIPMQIDGSSDIASYTNTPWTLQKTGTFTPGSPAGTGTVNWTVTVTKGATTSNLAVIGYVDLSNHTADAVPIDSFVVNLQKQVAGDFATVSSDVATAAAGDAATQATVDPSVTYEFIDTFTENAASGSLSLTDNANNPVALNSPLQSVPAGQTRRLYFVARYNATTLNLAVGTPLQLEVIVSFGNNFDIPSLSTTSWVSVPAPTVANGSVSLLDPSITASGTVTTGSFTGLNQILTGSGSFPLSVTANGGTAGGTVCNTANLTSLPTSISIDVNGTPVPLITIPGVNLTASNCQDIPKRPGEPKPLTTSINSCSQIVTYDASLFTSPSGPIVSAVFNPVSGSTFPFGTSQVSYTVTDSEGNVATGNLTVNVLDTEAPVITAISNIAVPTDAGSCTAIVTYSTTATDCNLASLTYSPASGTAFPIGTTVVTITATDTAGHQSTSTFSVTVNDVTAPTLHTANVQANVTPGTCSANVSFGATAEDCSAVSFVYSLSPSFSPAIVSGANFPMGTTTVYVKAIDAAGNETVGSFTVAVVDNEAPVITSPNLQATIAPGTCAAMVTLNASASDCSNVAIVYSLSPSFSPALASTSSFPIGTTTVYVKATDAAGNVATGSFTVTVTDNEAPVITATNITTNITPGTCAANVPFTASATDCSAFSLIYSLDAGFSSTIASGASFPIGSTTVYVKATDASGNSSTASFVVKVIDNEAPVLAVTPVQVNVAPGTCAANAAFAASATDCMAVTIVYALDAGFTQPVASGASFPIGTTTVFVKATDAAGNTATSSFTVKVVDNEAPVLTAANILANVATGTCAANVTFNASAMDCSAVTYVYSLSPTFSPAIASGASFPVGTTTVYVKATDAAGNSSSASFTVTVTDNQAPVLSVTNVQANVAPGSCSANVAFGASATDCSSVSLVYSTSPTFSPAITSGASFPIGTTTVYVKATDASGNFSTASFTVKVIDTQAPVLVASNIQTSVIPGTCAANVNFNVSATDCSAVSIVYSLSSTYSPAIVSGASFPVGTTTVYVKATDASGNVSTTTFTVKVVDSAAPVISAPNIVVNNDAGECGANVNFNVTVTDCSAVTLKYYLDSGCSTTPVVSGAQFPVGTTTVYVKATDASGNSTTKTFTVTVKDTQAPIITSSLSNITLDPSDCTCTATFCYTPRATDNCGGTIRYTVSPASGTVFDAGTTHTITVTATDSAGNVTTKTFTVTVDTCPAYQTTYTQGGWGAVPCGNNPGTLLWRYFSTVYPSGLVVGGNGGTYTLKFTSASAITNALPLSGTPAVLTKSYTNPTTLNNTFASQVVALKLNVDFSARDLLWNNVSNIGYMKLSSGELQGWTVYQVLSLANTVLGGKTSALPYGVTISDLTSIIASINQNYDNGTTNNGYLHY